MHQLPLRFMRNNNFRILTSLRALLQFVQHSLTTGTHSSEKMGDSPSDQSDLAPPGGLAAHWHPVRKSNRMMPFNDDRQPVPTVIASHKALFMPALKAAI